MVIEKIHIGQATAATLLAFVVGLPPAFLLLMLFMTTDVILGLGIALRDGGLRGLDKDKMYDGGLKKAVVVIICIVMMVADTYLFPEILGRDETPRIGTFALSTAFCLYFALRELLSIADHAENVGAGLPAWFVSWAKNLLGTVSGERANE